MKWLKRIGIGIAVVLVLIVAAIAIVSAMFDPNQYKPRIAQFVQDRYARTLAMDGPIALTFFPRLGVSISKVMLSEPRSAQSFAKIGDVRVSVAVLPLLSRKVVVDRIELHDVDANLARNADGTTNFDDLLGPQKPPAASTPTPAKDPGAASPPPAIDVGGVRISNLSIGWKDASAGTDLRLVDVNLELGQLATTASGKLAFSARVEGRQPKLDARIQVAGTYRIALDGAPGGKIELPQLDITLALKDGDLALQGTVGAAIAIDLVAKSFALSKLASEITTTGPAIPNGSLKISTTGQVALQWEKRSAAIDVIAKFDESTARINIALADYAKPDPRFKLDIDRLNVDRYLRKDKPAAPAASGASTPTGGAGAGKPVDPPIDLSPLASVNGAGSIHIGSLTATNVKSANVQVDMKAANGTVHLDPIKAELYSGTLAGAIAIDARTNRLAVRQVLTNVAIGPLLHDAASVDMLEGRGSVALDVAGAGKTVNALKRDLDGKAQVNLQDGALKGFNLADIARRARSLRSGEMDNAAASKVEKTDFSEMTASFIIRDGIATNDDLSMKSPFVRVNGAGRVDIPAGSVDYTVRPAIVATTAGQGGKGADDLRAIIVPVKIAGPFDQLRYSVDIGSLAKDAAKDEIQRQLEKRAKGTLDDATKERVGDVLKGLLRR
ncbi:MAG: AsmA family protein [Burkholderiales bacterium]